MSFNYKQIREIKISIAKGVWNPENHDIILSFDPKSPLGFKMKMIPVDPEIVDVTQAKEILQKYML